MTIEKDGGPAFARPYSYCESAAANEHAQEGMSLRDYFAAKALQGLLSCQSYENGFYQAKQVAQEAYAMADAMLEARKS